MKKVRKIVVKVRWIILVAFLPMSVMAQTLPAKIKSQLTRSYPGWKFDWDRSGSCGAEVRRSVVAGDFNGDRQTDYVVKFVKNRKGYVLGFIAQRGSYKAHLLESTSVEEIKFTILNVSRKGETYPVGDNSTRRLVHDAPYTVPCESDAVAFYIYQNGRFN